MAIGENSEDAIFNDILGTSLGVVKESGYSAIDKTSFGADSTDKSSFFTGKPYVEDLGYTFLFATTARILANGKCATSLATPMAGIIWRIAIMVL